MGWSKEARAAAALARRGSHHKGQLSLLDSSRTSHESRVPVHVGIGGHHAGHLELKGGKVTAHLFPAHVLHDGYIHSPGEYEANGKLHQASEDDHRLMDEIPHPSDVKEFLDKVAPGHGYDDITTGSNDTDEAGYAIGVKKHERIKVPTKITLQEFKKIQAAHKQGHQVVVHDNVPDWEKYSGLKNGLHDFGSGDHKYKEYHAMGVDLRDGGKATEGHGYHDREQ